METKRPNPDLEFSMCETEADLKKVYDYDADVFAESGDFVWSLQNLKKEQKSGWRIYSVTSEEDKEIISALFIKDDGDKLLTKNTSLKMSHQGKGISHKIKEFFENEAKKEKKAEIYHFCAVDNFRSIALNESHGYERLECVKNGEVIKWGKKLLPKT